MRSATYRSVVRSLAVAVIATLPALPADVVDAASAALPEPNWSPLSNEALEAARQEALLQADQPSRCAGSIKTALARSPRQAGAGAPTLGTPTPPWDDDSCHYARGNTLVLHILIDHGDRVWTQWLRDVRTAAAHNTKEWYRESAPPEANLRFDNPDGEGYYWFNPVLETEIEVLTTEIIEDVINAIGFYDTDSDGTAFDEFTMAYQDFGDGWDNVIAVFEPAERAGDSFAYESWGVIGLYSASELRHQMGHLFGGCDEFIENGTCDDGVGCGPCQGEYLDEPWDNKNCELSACTGFPNDCVMKNPGREVFCGSTRKHWGWSDGDGNGQLNPARRPVSASGSRLITELAHGGWVLTSEAEDSWVFAPQWNGWTVAGVRNPSGSDYDIELFHDNNHFYSRASSSADGSVVDLVVADYNHIDDFGNEHIQITHDSGPSSNYRLQWESGGHQLYPNGLSALQDWTTGDVVRIWDVALTAGETLRFAADPGGSLNVGMMLFRSYNNAFFGGRTDAEWVADAVGNGGEESYIYTVPVTDVYGLVIYANNAVTTNVGIQIGPTPTVIWEETPVLENDPLHLFSFAPQAEEWFAVAARPQSGVDVSLGLYEDYTYTTLLVEADDNAGVELAVGLRNGWDPGLVRAHKDGSAQANYRLEWDQAQTHSGYWTDYWSADEVVRIWPLPLMEGTNYFFRQTNTTEPSSLDASLHLFRTPHTDDNFSRSDREAGSDSHGPEDDGEWFSYFNFGGTHALAMTSEVAVGSAYDFWWGPLVEPADGEVRYDSHKVVFSESEPSIGWKVAAARPAVTAVDVDVFLMTDETYGAPRTSSYNSGKVNFCVGYGSRTPTTIYPRYRDNDGRGFRYEWQTPLELYDLRVANVDREQDWTDPNVVDLYEFDIPVAQGQEMTIRFEVEDLSGDLDLGLSLYEANESYFFLNHSESSKFADAYGSGGTESFECVYTDTANVALVVFNSNSESGLYRLRVIDDSATDAPEEIAPRTFAFELRSSHPIESSGTEFRLALPRDGNAEVTIYGTDGRRVRSLLRGDQPAGYHTLGWDGLDDRGRTIPTGVYFARAQSRDGATALKLVKTE